MAGPAAYKLFDNVTVSTPITWYLEDDDHAFSFDMHTDLGGVRVEHLGGGGDIFFSFNGVDDHGVVSASGRTQVVMLGIRANKIWLRANTGGTGLESVEVQAWKGN